MERIHLSVRFYFCPVAAVRSYVWFKYEDEFGSLEVQERILFKSRSPLITCTFVPIAIHSHLIANCDISPPN